MSTIYQVAVTKNGIALTCNIHAKTRLEALQRALERTHGLRIAALKLTPPPNVWQRLRLQPADSGEWSIEIADADSISREHHHVINDDACDAALGVLAEHYHIAASVEPVTVSGHSPTRLPALDSILGLRP
jgi:hypothetical protein